MALINRYHIVKTDTELLAAALFNSHVYIAYDDLDAGYKYVVAHGGPIERYTPYHVRIAGVNYSREQFEFRIHITK